MKTLIYLFTGLLHLSLSTCTNGKDAGISYTGLGCESFSKLTIVDSKQGTPVNTFRGTVITKERSHYIDCTTAYKSGPGYVCHDNNIRFSRPLPPSIVVRTISSKRPKEEVIQVTVVESQPYNFPFGSSCRQAWATIQHEAPCSQLSCEDSLRLSIFDKEDHPISTFRGAVIMDGVKTKIICDDKMKTPKGYRCESNVLVLKGVLKDTIDVSLKAGDKALRETITISAHLNQPNGPGCPPVCERAYAKLILK